MLWSDIQCYAKHDQRKTNIEHGQVSGGEIDIDRLGFQGSNDVGTSGKLNDYFE